MDFEKLLPIIFFMAIWGIINTVRKSPKEGGPVGKTSRVDPLAKLLAILQGDVEALRPVPRFDDEVIAIDEHLEPIIDTKPKKTRRPTLIPEEVRKPRPIADKTVNLGEVMVGKVGRPMEGDLCRQARLICRLAPTELRKAVIWSEILAPPVALRDE